MREKRSIVLHNLSNKDILIYEEFLSKKKVNFKWESKPLGLKNDF
jgi:hypothetical protein